MKHCPSAVFYSCSQTICYPGPKRKKRVVGFCPFLRCHVLKEQRSNAATRPHQRGTCWGRRTRPPVLGKPNTELGCGTQAAGPRGAPSLGKRNISGTSSWHLQQAESKEGGTGWAGFALQHFRDKAILLKKELGALQSVKHRGRASSVSIPLQSPVTRRRRRRHWEENSNAALCWRLRASPQKGEENQTGVWWLVSPRSSGRFVGNLSLCFPHPTPAARGHLPVP